MKKRSRCRLDSLAREVGGLRSRVPSCAIQRDLTTTCAARRTQRFVQLDEIARRIASMSPEGSQLIDGT